MDTPTQTPAETDEQGWDGDLGAHWVASLDRYEAADRRLTPHLMTAAGIGDGDRVLDVGCGGGATTLRAARMAGTGSALGVDISARLIAAARAKAAAADADNARFLYADAALHDFGEAEFDVVLSRFGVMFFPDPRAAFANLARALRPGGRLAFLCWQELAANEFLGVRLGAVAAIAPPPDLGEPGGPGPFSLSDPQRIRGLLGPAGFTDVSVTAVREPIWTGYDVEDAVAFTLTTPMAQTMLAAADPDLADQAVEALTAALTPYAGPSGVELGGAAWLVTATRV